MAADESSAFRQCLCVWICLASLPSGPLRSASQAPQLQTQPMRMCPCMRLPMQRKPQRLPQACHLLGQPLTRCARQHVSWPKMAWIRALSCLRTGMPQTQNHLNILLRGQAYLCTINCKLSAALLHLSAPYVTLTASCLALLLA